MRRKRLKSVFFDVGNTLTYADLAVTLHPLTKRGLRPTDAQLRNAEIETRRWMDTVNVSGAGVDPDAEYWKIFLGKLMDGLGVHDEALLAEVIFEWRSARNWTRVASGTAEVLDRLAAQYDLAVISNADGTIARLLKKVELARYFRTITDSGVVGHRKPSAEIFHLAMASITTAPEQSVYIGDVYSIDVLGAQRVGMEAILFDHLGTYQNLDVPKIGKLEELEALLANL